MEHCDVLEKEKAEIKAMNRKIQKTKKILVPEQVADTNLLKESMIKKQAEIEAVMIEGMKKQVGDSVEQCLESEVNEEMFFDEEIQQNVIESVDKPFKENIFQDVGELSSEEEVGKME